MIEVYQIMHNTYDPESAPNCWEILKYHKNHGIEATLCLFKEEN